MALSGVVLMEFGDLAVCRRMLRGVKARSEALAWADEGPDLSALWMGS
jgi:hypothetical protein